MTPRPIPSTHTAGTDPGARAADPEGGYVLVTLAIMFVLLMLFAGYSVDVGNWNLHRNKAQTAAEAAALGGVAFLPDNFTTAELTARQLALHSGYDASQVQVELGKGDNQLKVTITEDVDNYFLRVIGVDSHTIRRTATAEFEQPVEMGSPSHVLGNDPEIGYKPDYWLSIAARNVSKDLGDRFSTRRCSAGTGNCTGTWNLEYDTSGYKYAVRVSDTTQPMRIQIFDPGWTWTGSSCDIPNWPTAAEIAQLQTFDDGGYPDIPVGYFDDAAARFAGGETAWCTGDDRPGTSGPATRFSVHLPDTTPWNDNDNVEINIGNACRPRTFAAVSPTSPYAPPTQSIFEYLSPVHGGDGEWRVRNDATLTFAESFRRWFTICDLSPGPWLRQGDYIVKVVATDATAGQNRYSLRAGPPSGTGVSDIGQSTFSRGRLPIYANTSSADIQFYLARVPPSSGERLLKVSFFDVGDAAAPGTLSVQPPPGALGLGYFPDCDFTLAGVPVASSNCSLPNVLDSNGYGEQIVEAVVTIPSQNDPDPDKRYWCDVSDPDDCWVTIRAQFPGGITDATTWTAELVGDAVRVVDG